MNRLTKHSILPKPEYLQHFVNLETLGGIILLLCSAVALYLSNSPWEQQFAQFWNIKIGVSIGSYHMTHAIKYWVNEGLMAIFFFVIGLEIKQEVLFGELNSPDKVILPVIAATGGAVVPAFLYYLVNRDTSGVSGWGIPMATDIAFVLGIIALLGRRVPRSIKVFVLAFAIIDDLIAILVIAIFYTDHFQLGAFLLGSGTILVAILLNRVGFYQSVLFMVLGWVSWFAILESGIHPTIAGVAMAIAVPSLRKTHKEEYAVKVMPLIAAYSGIKGDTKEEMESQEEIISQIKYYSDTTDSPMHRLIFILHPISSFLIIPLFALANAGVHLDAGIFGALAHHISIGVILGLFIGKPVGIFTSIWLCVRLRLATLPALATWKQVFAMACLGGMGFTLSLFISVLAFGDTPPLTYAKVGVLTGSLFAVLTGCVLFRINGADTSENGEAAG